MTSGKDNNQPTPLQPTPLDAPVAGKAHHDFDVQKEIHQRIRNDPDYDDWEYGTEPLPHEAWVARQQATSDGGSSG